MGFVYKLTDIVRNFIIARKEENLGLSCRELAVLVKKKLKRDVSKSSINGLLKAAGLSSSVGRKAKSPSQKPAKIVPEKPLQSLAAQPEKLLEIKPPEKTALLIPLQEKLTALEKPQPQGHELPPISPEKKQALKPFLPSPQEPFPEAIEIKEVKPEKPEAQGGDSLQLIEVKEDEIIDNLGFFFLKATELQFSESSIIAEAVKTYLTQYEPQDLEAKSQALLYLVALGFKDPAEIKAYDNKDIWVINQIKHKSSPESLLKFVEDFSGLKSLTLALSMVANRFFSEVSFLKITLADNTVLYIDSQFKSIWHNSDIPEIFSTTLTKSIGYIKSSFQENVQSANIFTAPGYFSFTSAFYEFVLACEDLPQKRMLRITLHSDYKDEIGSAIKLSAVKRYFIMGFWPWQNEGNRFIQQDLRIIESFFSQELNKEIFYSENKVNLPQYQSFQGVKIRVALLRDSGLSWPRMGILTNLPQEEPMEGIISEYLKRWPNQDEAYQDFLKKSEKTSYTRDKPAASRPSSRQGIYTISSERMDLWQNLSFLVNTLSSFAQRYFFPKGYENADFSTMKQRFYSLPGSLKRQGNCLFISLKPPAGYAFQKELFYAMRRVNESDCQTAQGLRIRLKPE